MSESLGAVAGTIRVAFGDLFTAFFSGNSQDISISFNPSNILGSYSASGTTVAYVSPGEINTIPDGNYTLEASYQRVADNSIVASTLLPWTIWGRTPPPYFIGFPAVTKLPIYVQVGWGTNPFGSSATTVGTRSLGLSNGTTEFEMGFLLAETTSFTLDPNNGWQDSAGVVAMGNPYYPSDGYYNLTFSYRDARPHVVASVKVLFRLDTISEPLNITRVTSTFVEYTVPEPGNVDISWDGGAVAGTAYVGVPNFFVYPSREPLTFTFSDTLQNPPFSVNVTVPAFVIPTPAPSTSESSSISSTWIWVAAIVGGVLVTAVIGCCWIARDKKFYQKLSI